MVDAELRKIVYDYIKEICHFSQMQVFATSYYQKNYFQLQIDNRIDELINQISEHTSWAYEESFLRSNQQQQEEDAVRQFTLEELSTFDGKEGRPAYVAVNNTVYDLSGVPAWQGGLHNGQEAGKDLSSVFMGCHQGVIKILERYPIVGVLVEKE